MGSRADLVVIDEAYNLTAEQMAAVLPTMSARPNPQVWYTSSAGMPSSEQLSRVRSRGVAGGDPSLAFFEWSAEPGAELDDRQAWAQANPSLGYRIRESFVDAERAALPPDQFGRERLGLWADRAAGSAAIELTAWADLADSGEQPGRPTFGVATAPDRSWSAVAAAWTRYDGLQQVTLLDYRPSTVWVRARVEELRARWGGRVITDTASRDLVLDGHTPGEAEQARAHNGLADAVTARTVRHGDDAAVNVSVKASRWRQGSKTRELVRNGPTDVSPLVAEALALHGSTEPETAGGWMVGV